MDPHYSLHGNRSVAASQCIMNQTYDKVGHFRVPINPRRGRNSEDVPTASIGATGHHDSRGGRTLPNEQPVSVASDHGFTLL